MTTEPRGNTALANDTYYVEPATGHDVGARLRGKWCLERENFLNWSYELHHSLTIGEPGRWLMGLAALVGCGTCFMLIVQGARRRDRKSLIGAGLALLCLVFAITCVDMNLDEEVFKPTVSLFSKAAPDVYSVRGRMTGAFGERWLTYAEALCISKVEGLLRGYGDTVGELITAMAIISTALAITGSILTTRPERSLVAIFPAMPRPVTALPNSSYRSTVAGSAVC